MKEIITIIFIAITSSLFGQPLFQNVYQNDTFTTYFLDANTEYTNLEVTDTAYYTWGLGLDSSLQVAPPYGWYKTGVFSKIDINGDIIHQKVYGSYYNIYNIVSFGIDKTNDGNFFLGGSYYDTLQAAYFLMKVNHLGDTLWQQLYEPTTPNSPLGLRNVRATSDGGAILLVYQITDLNVDVSVSIPILIKVDSLGIEEWRRTYFRYDGYNAVFADVLENNNQYILISVSYKGSSERDLDYKLIMNIQRLDSTGNLIDEYVTPTNEYITGFKIIQTQDKGFIVCGAKGTQMPNTNPIYHIVLNDSYIMKLDSNLQFVWEHTMPNLIKYESFRDVEEFPDGSLIAVGNDITAYPVTLPLYEQADSSDRLGYAVKFTAEGQVMWDRKYKELYNLTHQTYHYLRDVEVLPDGGLLMAGYVEEGNLFNPNSGYHGWLIRTDSFGCIVPGCQLLDNTENVKVFFDNDVTVFPNPASDVVNFKFDKVINEKAVIRVYSGLGQLIGETAIDYSDMAQLNSSDWQSGMYFYGVYLENQLVKQGQILVGN